jgi:spore germination cell wall hydrolase CwlJ-like protein
MKKMISIIISIIALTVMAPGHADEVEVSKPTFVGTVVQQAQDRFETLVGALSSPIVDINVTGRDIDCLAKNIYYEAGAESEEGKVAVAMVTINRVRDGRFGKTICSVVDQKTVRVKSIEKTEVRMVQGGFFGNPEKQTVKTITMQNVDVCQFSWRCVLVRKPKDQDSRWQASQEVAARLLKGDYIQWQLKYSDALYFHATSIKPAWAKGKQHVARVGGHHFYADTKV